MSTFRQRSVPLWAVTIGLALMVGSLVTCQQQAARMELWDDARGQPLDHPGGLVACPECTDNSLMLACGGYWFRCQTCGLRCEARRNPETGEISYQRDKP